MKKRIRYVLEMFLMMALISCWFIVNKLNYQYLHTFAEGSGNNIILGSVFEIRGYLTVFLIALGLLALTAVWNGWTLAVGLYQSIKIIDLVLVVINVLICFFIIIGFKDLLLRDYALVAILAFHFAYILLAIQFKENRMGQK